MQTITLALKSRTFWTIVFIVVTNAINANAAFIPASVLSAITVLAGLLATYFHLNPSQSYGKSVIIPKN